MNGFVKNMTGIFLNMTGFALNMTEFVFSDLGLIFQNLQVYPKQIKMLFSQMCPYFKLVLRIFTTHITTKCIKCLFHMEKAHRLS